MTMKAVENALAKASASVKKGWKAYRENWRKVVWAFAVIFAFALFETALDIANRFSPLFSLFRIGAGLSGALVLLSIAVAILSWLVSHLITLSVMRPLYEMVSGKKEISEWRSLVRGQILNTVKVIAVRFAAGLIIMIPFGVWLLANVGVFGALMKSDLSAGSMLALFGGSLLLLIPVLAVVLALAFIVNLLLTFFEVELVIAGRGAGAAVKASVALAKANVGSVLAYNLVWSVLGIAIAIASVLACLTCILLPVVIVVGPLVVQPVQQSSLIALWMDLKKVKKQN